MADETAALVPVREQTVDFYGDTLVAAEGPDARIYVPLRLLCDYLGLSWAGQRERTLRHPVLAPALKGVRVTRTPLGGPQTTLCLPLDLLPGWLFGISAERVRPTLREKIIRYQAECFQVLWNAFKGDILPPPAASTASGAELALEVARAVVRLAEQQLAIEQQVAGLGQRFDALVYTVDRRFSALEVRLDPKQVLTEAEAAELALAVKHVGHALDQAGGTGGYGRVYSELYRRYQVSSYKNLPRAKLAEVLAWLHGWHAELEGQG